MVEKRDRLEGAVLGGRFRLVRCLGAGAMGRVYLAQHLRLPRRYAIKVLPAELTDRTVIQRFAIEAEAASRLHHPNVASVVDHGTTERGVPYLVMELCEGETLTAKLDRAGALPPLEALDLLRQIASGLDHAHRCGLIHRDLKPDNVMIEAEDGRARILDFGLALLPELGTAGRFTARGVAIGSPAFMAPEQARAGELDARTDLFALGVMMFLMLTGEMPFPAADLTDLLRHLVSKPTPKFAERAPKLAPMPDLETICHALMAKKREERPATAAAVVALFDAAIERRKAPPAARPKRFAWFGLRHGVEPS
jgi:eukaryotic-like serine/threonine-protein kinase